MRTLRCSDALINASSNKLHLIQMAIAPKEGDIEPIDFVTDAEQIVKIVNAKIRTVHVSDKPTEQVHSSSGERRRNGMLSLDVLSPKVCVRADNAVAIIKNVGALRCVQRRRERHDRVRFGCAS